MREIDADQLDQLDQLDRVLACGTSGRARSGRPREGGLR
jgi:hypothetical protein